MNTSYDIEFYQDADGHCPTDKFLNDMPQKHLAKVHAYLELLEKEGPNLQRPHADTLGGKIRELRRGFGHHEYRLLYFFSGKTIVVTHGFLKKTDRVPRGEIERAPRCMNDWVTRR